MRVTTDELETALQKISEKVVNMCNSFHRETDHLITEIQLSIDEFGNLGAEARVEISGAAIGIKRTDRPN